MAPQFNATKPESFRSLALWIAWAKTSLPVPLSPVIKMVEGLFATIFAFFTSDLMALLFSVISAKVNLALLPVYLFTNLIIRLSSRKVSRKPSSSFSLVLIGRAFSRNFSSRFSIWNRPSSSM